MNILVTGGAGYIGSFMTKRLIEKSISVTVVDSLERGHKKVIDEKANFIEGNLLDKNFVSRLFSENQFDAVIHLAGYISMAESVEKPYLYFENNVISALNILEKMVKNKMNKFIFSSTAGVYGNPTKIPISEDHKKNPTNPYGESKLMVEKILAWYRKIHGLSFASLRYFNASGASFDGSMGEDHNPETHIIPNAIKAAIRGSEFILYGDDYNTKDGTCIRDYIHVIDLVEAHILALERLQKENGSFFYNVGSGKGYSNKEVVNMVKEISGIDFKVKNAGRREGDADVLIADPSKIIDELKFDPKFSDLKNIVETAWKWHAK